MYPESGSKGELNYSEMNPVFHKATAGCLPTLLLLLAGLGPLFGQAAKQSSYQLEAHFTFQSFFNNNTVQVIQEDGVRVLNIFETTPQLSFGGGLRINNSRNYYSRLGLVGLSSNKAADLLIRASADSTIVAASNGAQTSTFNLHLRFERGKYFALGEKVTFGLGALVDPVMTRRKVDQFIATGFSTTATFFRLDFGIVPSLAWQVGGRLHLVCEAPLPVVRVGYQTSFLDNLFVLEDNRRQSSFETDFLLRSLQTSIGVRVDL